MIKILKIYAVPKEKKQELILLTSLFWLRHSLEIKKKEKKNHKQYELCIARRSKRLIIIYFYKILKVNKETPEQSENKQIQDKVY